MVYRQYDEPLFDFPVYLGEPLTLPFTVKDASGVSQDITGFHIWAVITTSPSGDAEPLNVYDSIAGGILIDPDQVNNKGNLDIEISASDTAEWPTGSLWITLRMEPDATVLVEPKRFEVKDAPGEDIP